MAFPSLALATTLFIFSFYTVHGSFAGDDSLTINLLHRDSIDSPFYDGSMTFSQRLGHALQRSFNNAKRYKCVTRGSTYKADLIPDHGEFLMNISFGNPSHIVLAIADTGSDLSWMQCKPCIQCYEHTGIPFNPKSSSTYEPVGCKSKTCNVLSSSLDTRCSSRKNCQFFESYADGSFSNGTVSTDTVTLGKRVLKNIVFGCSFYNDGVFQPTWGGIIGLGGGEYSLVSQIIKYVPAKFSYCLIPFPDTDGISNKTSKMVFGNFDFGPNVVSTPLVQGITKTFYHVTLEGISVGNTRVDMRDHSNSSKPVPKGNMIVDSGTTLTMLPAKQYNEFERALKDAINVRTIKDPQKTLDLCYRSAKVTKMPKVMMHFDGADVELSRENVFVTVSKHIMCLAFSSTTSIPVMGNLAQINHLVGYDLENKMLSFKTTDCQKM
ncbi:putative nepenthesin [Helianthus annuus]|nr:putative nepenthesin [Helianthus annuus]KAJ0518550.1 putative nepenthesin [Helianthus annuus]KAJ0686586.1 putative nepenthesin [Helianthus annuus]KAJ0690401.1 putative nepenthesin [Helianthus annuus]KAJ0871938.1 putative nepenthesin [Helianthus annuus]